MSSVLAPEHQLSAEPALSPALQSYLRDCVHERLQQDGCASADHWFRVRLYLQLGDAACATTLGHDLRAPAVGACAGLIAIFGQLAPGLSCQQALAHQMVPMQTCDKQLKLLSPCTPNQAMQLERSDYRYSILMMHEKANSLHCMMPCPMLMFSPVH